MIEAVASGVPAGSHDDRSSNAAGRLGYQPALDGLRAVAIVAVMVFHGGFHAPALMHWGSWLGVDLFFVLSGFLITTLLLREFGGNARISLRNFYVRRALRLYPMIVVCVLIAVVTSVLRIDAIRSPTWLGIASIAGYFNNWLIIGRHGTGDLGDFAHLWSLAVEEQFYIVWPILVVLTLRFGGRRAALLLLSAALAAASALLRYRTWLDARRFREAHYFEFKLAGEHLTQAWNTIYYGSLTHSDGLLVGCALAALLGMQPRRPAAWVRGVVGVLATAAIGLNYFIFRGTVRVPWPTFMTTWGQLTFNIGVAFIVAHLLFSPGAPLGRILATRPLVWIGRRSYGMYVIHPLAISIAAGRGLTTIPWMLGAIGTSMLVAGVSYRYYEAPILRLKERFERH